jgi:phage terminase large subunit-like protein
MTLSEAMISEATLSHFVWRKLYFREDNATPKFHYEMCEHLYSDKRTKAIQAFRGSAKTTNCCYMALHRVESGYNYTLIISDTATQAESIIADIQSMIEDSALPYRIVRAVIGELELEYMGNRYFIVGKGAGASLRGIKRNRKRPDLILIDDLLNDEVARNRLRLDRLQRWYFKALLPSLDPKGEIWFIGTPMTKADIFMKVCEMYPTLKVPLTDTAWSDRFSPEWIRSKKAEYTQMGMLREWKGEYELVLTDSETALFDTSKIRSIDYLPSDVKWYMTCDLAFSDKETADYSALTVIGVDKYNQIYCCPYQLRGRPSEVANEIYRLIAKYNILDVGIEQGSSYIAVEEYLTRMMNDYNNYFNIIELKHGGRSKHSRIASLEPLVESKRLIVVDLPELATEELMEQFELTDRDSCMAEHDDLIDALAFLSQLDLIYYEDSEFTREQYHHILTHKHGNPYD